MKVLLFLASFVALGLCETKYLVGGSFTSANTQRAPGMAIFTEADYYDRPQYLPPVDYSTSGMKVTTVGGSDRFLQMSPQNLGIGYFDGTRYISRLGEIGEGNDGRFNKGVFDCVNTYGSGSKFNGPCTANIANFVVSGSIVFACGDFNKIGNTFQNFTSVVGNGYSGNVRRPHIAAFQLSDTPGNAKGKWNIIWPTQYDDQGIVSGDPKSWTCSSMVAVGNTGRMSILGGDGFHYKFECPSSSTCSNARYEGARSPASTVTYKTWGDSIFMYTKWSDDTNANNYIVSYNLGAGNTRSVWTVYNDTWSDDIVDWTVGSSSGLASQLSNVKIFFTIKSRPSSGIREDTFRDQYVWRYDGATFPALGSGVGSLGIFISNPLGEKSIRLCSSVACGVTGATGTGVVRTPSLFWDRKRKQLIAYGGVRHVVRGNDEANTFNEITGIQRNIARWSYWTRQVRDMVYWSGDVLANNKPGTGDWFTAYGGGVDGTVSQIAQEDGVGRIYIWGSSINWSYQNFVPYVAQYNKDAARWSFPVSPIVQLDGQPMSGSGPVVHFAKWIKIKGKSNLLLAGSFRSINGFSNLCNSIVALENDQKENSATTINTFPPSGGAAVGVRSTSSGNIFSALRSPGTIIDVVVDGEKIYVAGSFDLAGTVAAGQLAVYDSEKATWSDLGTGFGPSSMLNTIVLHSDGHLWIGGKFWQVGNVSSINVAHRDIKKGQWLSANFGVTSQITSGASVNRLISYKSKIYAFGSQQVSSGVNSPYVTKWTGKAWTAPDTQDVHFNCNRERVHEEETCQLASGIDDVYIMNDWFYVLASKKLWKWKEGKGWNQVSIDVSYQTPAAWAKVLAPSPLSSKSLYCWDLYASQNSWWASETNTLTEFNTDVMNFVATEGYAGVGGGSVYHASSGSF